MRSALREMHRKGFMAASVNDILDSTGLTRGALYHHFPNKKALGLAALDLIERDMVSMWLEPLADCGDPLTRLQEIMAAAGAGFGVEDIVLGCPLNNLAQEMSPNDEDFRRRIAGIYERWSEGIARALERGQAVGTVRTGLDCRSTAFFFVAALTGGRGLAKNAQQIDLLAICAQELAGYLEGLRA